MPKIQSHTLNHQPPLVPCNIQETLNERQDTNCIALISTEI